MKQTKTQFPVHQISKIMTSHELAVQRCEDRLEQTFGHLGSICMLAELDLALTHSTLTPIMREAITRKRDSIQDQLLLWGRFVRTTDRALGISR